MTSSSEDPRPPQDMAEAWRRTLVARRSPDYEAGIAWALEHDPSPEDLLDAWELRGRMGIERVGPDNGEEPGNSAVTRLPGSH
jgi:hypothetical protein